MFEELTPALIQLATNGGFAALVWYLVVKHIPNIEERHEKERDRWNVYSENRDREHNETQRQWMEKLDAFSAALREVAENARK